MKLYLETTVPNFLFADDSPDKKMATEAFFEWLKISPDDLYASVLVEAEISRAKEPKRSKMLRALGELNITLLQITSDAQGLAKCYIKEKVIPPRVMRTTPFMPPCAC